MGRPFALGVHPFAARGLSFAEASARGGGFQEYLEALARVTLSGLPAQKLPTTGRGIDWPLPLTWLSRDQEARFAGWRSGGVRGVSRIARALRCRTGRR
ncbi:MAG: hypothetical protein R3B70_20565 [Polyangiaceae bacterium]